MVITIGKQPSASDAVGTQLARKACGSQSRIVRKHTLEAGPNMCNVAVLLGFLHQFNSFPHCIPLTAVLVVASFQGEQLAASQPEPMQSHPFHSWNADLLVQKHLATLASLLAWPHCPSLRSRSKATLVCNKPD